MTILCPVCNSHFKEWKHLYFYFAVYRCQGCGFIRAKELPSEQDLNNRYLTYTYREESKPDYITTIRYKKLLTQFEKYRKTSNVLDYGCGEGHFLDIAKLHRWNPFGYEISEKAKEIVRQKGVCALSISEFEKYKETFDVITCIEVIEHVRDISEIIRHLFALLREGGCLYITTPNINSLSLRFQKERGNVIAFPEHLNYFSTRSIRTLFETQFSIVSLKTTGLQPFPRQATIHGIVAQAKHLNIKSEQKWHFKIFKTFINLILSIFGIGDTLKILVEKCSAKTK